MADAHDVLKLIDKLEPWERVKLASELMRQALDPKLPRAKALSILGVAQGILQREVTAIGGVLAVEMLKAPKSARGAAT